MLITNTDILSHRERSPDLPTGLFNWFGKFNSIPDSYVLNHHSLDAFLLLRYLKIATTICFVGCCITWPILWPVTITGGGGQTELNRLAFPNVVNKYRYYAHTFVAWIFSSKFWTADEQERSAADTKIRLRDVHGHS